MGCLILKWDGAAIDRTLTGKYDYAFIFNTVAVVDDAPPPTNPLTTHLETGFFLFQASIRVAIGPGFRCDWLSITSKQSERKLALADYRAKRITVKRIARTMVQPKQPFDTTARLA